MSEATFPLASPRVRVAPSILAADFCELGNAVHQMETAGAELLHLDVMDGRFVPNISFGVPVIASLRRRTGLFFDAHLMIDDPMRYAESFAKAGSNLISYHVEAVKDQVVAVRRIRELGVAVGVALNPTTPASAIDEVIEMVDLVLVMSVWPGFGGQSFIADVLPKVSEIRSRLRSDQRLEIDGGIDHHTIADACRAGADTIVAGTAVFGAPDPSAAYAELVRLGTSAAK